VVFYGDSRGTPLGPPTNPNSGASGPHTTACRLGPGQGHGRHCTPDRAQEKLERPPEPTHHPFGSR
jgi:hypothetical protein